MVSRQERDKLLRDSDGHLSRGPYVVWGCVIAFALLVILTFIGADSHSTNTALHIPEPAQSHRIDEVAAAKAVIGEQRTLTNGPPLRSDGAR